MASSLRLTTTAEPVPIAPHILVESVNDEVLLVDTQTSKCFSLTGSAAVIFHAYNADGQAAAARLLVKKYGISMELAEQDVASLLAELRHARILEP